MIISRHYVVCKLSFLIRFLYIVIQKEEAKTKGKNWFNLPATKVTDSVRHDLELIRMRSALDTKRFYKRNDIEHYPKYFQVSRLT